MRKVYFLFIFIIVFNLIYSKNITFNFNVPKGKIEYFKAGDINTQSQLFYDRSATLDLDKKEYYFLFSTEGYPSIQKVIDIKKIESPIEIDFNNIDFATIEGVVKAEDSFLGNVTVTFIDAQNHGYNFSSDIFGKFTAKIPPGYYKVSANKSGFISKNSEDIIYDFSSKINSYNLEINLEELPSFIRGQILDENGLGIPHPQVAIKNGEEIVKIVGDRAGIFSLPVKSGIVTILGQKKGYIQNGTVRKIEKNSSITNIEIPLTRKRYSITGTVTDSIKALKDIQLQLMGEDYNKIATTVTNENGFFEFYKIPGNRKVFILISSGNKIIKKSEVMELNKDIKNFNIILNN